MTEAIRLGLQAPPDLEQRVRDSCFGHAFGQCRRVLGFGGKLGLGGGELLLEQFLLCCTGQVPAGEVDGLRGGVAARLRRPGWSPTAAGEGRLCWRKGAAEFTWVEADGNAAGSRLIHLVLTWGSPGEVVYRRVFGFVSDFARNLGLEKPGIPAAEPRAGLIGLAAEELATQLSGRVVVYTGAGVSLASGIATFEGEGSLNARVPLMEPFPGSVLDWMIERPGKLARVLGRFQASLLAAEPNPAHRALAQLERLGRVAAVVTNNFDRLHERAGSRLVRRPHATRRPLLDGVEVDLLLVTGVSTDEHGLIARLRRAGTKVIGICPEAPPCLVSGDRIVYGRAEEVLPRVVEALRAVPPAPCSAEDFARLVEKVRLAAAAGSSLHGDRHWRRVAWLGAHLAAETPGCDPWVVLLFALLHDSQRVNESHDPEHGPRAAMRAQELNGELMRLDVARLELLVSACIAHADGRRSRNPTVGACWDADRLDLWRCDMTPDPRYLSTAAALEPERIRWSQQETSDEAWDELYRRFACIAPSGTWACGRGGDPSFRNDTGGAPGEYVEDPDGVGVPRERVRGGAPAQRVCSSAGAG